MAALLVIGVLVIGLCVFAGTFAIAYKVCAWLLPAATFTAIFVVNPPLTLGLCFVLVVMCLVPLYVTWRVMSWLLK